MRIVVDLQGIQNKSKDRGIGRYVLSLARALGRYAGDHEIFYLINKLYGDSKDEIIAVLGGISDQQHIIEFHGVGPAMEPHGDMRANLRLSEVLLADLLREVEADVFLVGSFIEGWDDNTITHAASPFDDFVTAGVLHDLIPLLDRSQYLSYQPAHDWYFRRLEHLDRCQVILTISESAQREALDHLGRDPARIAIVGSAASEDFARASAAASADADGGQPILARLGIDRPFLMHTSAFDERKNFEGLVKAYAQLPAALRTGHQLVLVCKVDAAGRARIARLAQDNGLSADEVVMTGFVSDDELAVLYHRAKLFVFPSFHEGFGLPPLEAMSCGTPAIGSNTTSVPEVIGREDALFDPASPPDMSRVIARALSDDGFYRSLKATAAEQARFFNWERTSALTFAALEKAVARHSAERAASRDIQAPSLQEKIAFIARMHDIGQNLQKDFAIALSRNRAGACRARAMARPDNRLTWRIEGPFDSSYSLALVNRETARALAWFGHFVVLHSTEGPGDFPPDPAFLAQHRDLAEMHERTSAFPAERCDALGRNIYPPRVSEMRAGVNALHQYGWEETGFPADWVRSINENLQFMTVVSEHVRKVMIDSGVRVPVTVTGAGVDHWLRVEPSSSFAVPGKGFRFLHVSSCFPRKGIDDLLQAYGQAFSQGDDVTLIIKTFPNPHNMVEAQLAEHRRLNPSYPAVVLIMDDLSDSDLKALYAGCDVMVGPSRAEGFSLPLAEAMLSGIPVIATAWSGQMDFCNESNSWLVDYSFEKTDTHFDLWSSVWARVKVPNLREALQAAFSSKREQRDRMAENGRAQLLERHTWADSAARLIEAACATRSRPECKSNPKVGWLTTWNARCGIATYSEHLVGQLPLDTTILANHDPDRLGADADNVVRCWKQSKDFNRFCDILPQIDQRQLAALVIQFNYAFFNHEELAEFLKQLKERQVTTVLMMHSTQDPVLEIPGNELYRIADELALADRILVHSVGDLNRLKAIGLIDNVALFPHGVKLLPSYSSPASQAAEPVIATYGFALPGKGLEQVIEAVAALNRAGTRVRLKLINAEFPAQGSRDLIAQLKQRVAALKLDKLVEFHNEFLSDEESMALLRSADLILFAYQGTKESASGAVRYGLSSGKPVAVTPCEIFSDVLEVTHHLSGISGEAIAGDLKRILFEERTGAEGAKRLAERARSWREQHDYAWLGQRLAWLLEALVSSRASNGIAGRV